MYSFLLAVSIAQTIPLYCEMAQSVLIIKNRIVRATTTQHNNNEANKTCDIFSLFEYCELLNNLWITVAMAILSAQRVILSLFLVHFITFLLAALNVARHTLFLRVVRSFWAFRAIVVVVVFFYSVLCSFYYSLYQKLCTPKIESF